MAESHAGSVRTLAAAILRTGLLLGAAAAAVALAAAAALAGWPGVLGAGTGIAVAFVSSLFTIVLMRLTAALPVAAMFGAVLGGYTMKVAGLLMVAVPLRGVEQFHPMAFGMSVLAVVVAWAAAGVVAFKRTRIPTIIPAPAGSGCPDRSGLGSW